MSRNPTDSEFYTFFTKGLEARGGQRVKRDVALSIEIVVEMQRIWESVWTNAVMENNEMRQRDIAEWTARFLCNFCHRLRGWKGVKAVASMFRTQIFYDDEAASLGVTPHLGLPLHGSFRSCGNSTSYLLCKITGETASGLTPVLWALRLLRMIDQQGNVLDWLFQHKAGRRKKMSDFNEMFYDTVYDIQRRSRN
jgi:hypothetical protein